MDPSIITLLVYEAPGNDVRPGQFYLEGTGEMTLNYAKQYLGKD